jgi:hypothetical protein
VGEEYPTKGGGISLATGREYPTLWLSPRIIRLNRSSLIFRRFSLHTSPPPTLTHPSPIYICSRTPPPSIYNSYPLTIYLPILPSSTAHTPPHPTFSLNIMYTTYPCLICISSTSLPLSKLPHHLYVPPTVHSSTAPAPLPSTIYPTIYSVPPPFLLFPLLPRYAGDRGPP